MPLVLLLIFISLATGPHWVDFTAAAGRLDVYLYIGVQTTGDRDTLSFLMNEALRAQHTAT